MRVVLRERRRPLGLLACGATVLVWLCAVPAIASALPNGRAYELVSPVAKNGTGVVPYSQRTRASADGNALQFLSLGAFADAMGTGIATDYLSERTGAQGSQGWSTHAITPYQSGATYDELAIAGFEPLYVGEFTQDLSTGVFFAQSPLTNDPSTANVPNLYLRTDLRSPGPGTYDLITHCPYCDATRTVLQGPSTPVDAFGMPPVLAWMSPDGSHVAFESTLRLTADTPAFLRRVELYEWDRVTGSVALAGRMPRSAGAFCDDANGPACVAAQYSFAGQGASNNTRTPNVVSDGSDGHTRVFFTFPTVSGLTLSPSSSGGQLYMRVDGTSTVKLNASERSAADAFAPATFLDASMDSERVFFRTTQALTNDTPADGASHIYMYDASLPPSAPHHLTLINADREPGDGTSSTGVGIVGRSDDGRYVYFVSEGQIVSGQPPLGGVLGLYLWHDGTVRYIASAESVLGGESFTTGGNIVATPRQSRVTPDGRWLLYRAVTGLTRQLYLYSADSGAAPVCISCDPSGSTANATDIVQTGRGATSASWHVNHALSDHGAFVFFSSAQALVPEAVNDRVNVYEYDVALGRVFLISSGTSTDDSWFMDASADGRDVFFTTRQQLVGWDIDQEYDIYDARTGGGFPNPSPVVPPCQGTVCQGSLAPPPLVQTGAGAVFHGVGNAPGTLKPRVRPCRRGYARKRVRGRLRCVKRAKRRARARRARAHRRPVGHRRTA